MVGLLAHRYRHSDADLTALMATVQRLCGPDDRIVLGRDDHEWYREQTRLQGAGWSWNLWATSVAERYQIVILVPDEQMRVGRPTAVMANEAIAKGRDVVVLALDPKTNAPMLLRAVDCVATENGNYKRVVVKF